MRLRTSSCSSNSPWSACSMPLPTPAMNRARSSSMRATVSLTNCSASLPLAEAACWSRVSTSGVKRTSIPLQYAQTSVQAKVAGYEGCEARPYFKYGWGSGIAAPSLRGDDAPKFTPVLASRSTAAAERQLGEARRFERGLNVHAVIHPVRNGVRLRLIEAAHDAEADVNIALSHEGRNNSVERRLRGASAFGSFSSRSKSPPGSAAERPCDQMHFAARLYRVRRPQVPALGEHFRSPSGSPRGSGRRRSPRETALGRVTLNTAATLRIRRCAAGCTFTVRSGAAAAVSLRYSCQKRRNLRRQRLFLLPPATRRSSAGPNLPPAPL